MTDFPILSVILFIPLTGAVLVSFFRANKRVSAILATGASFLSLTGTAWLGATGISSSFSGVEEVSWIPSLGASYRVGVDGISYPVVLLTALLFFSVIIYAVRITKKTGTFLALLLLLETACLGVFMSLDLILFYIFFEVTLVGMYFIIAGWGHKERKKAAITFFIYTLIGSLFLLLALLSLYLNSDPHTFDMRALIAHPLVSGLTGTLTFWALFLAFAIKTPLFPFHSWLPLAHTEAPAEGSALLAGILLKLGAYGFIRFALQMTPEAFRANATIVVVIAVISVLYGALVALAQHDIKRMVAFTSINHMGYLVFGVAAASVASEGSLSRALDGATLQMVSHGVVTGMLFLLVGSLQRRTTTRDMSRLGGILKTYPVLGGLFILAAFASLGLPGLAHFPAEFQIFLGGYVSFPVAVAIMLTGLVLTTALYLRAIQRSFMGDPMPEIYKSPTDLSRRELAAVLPLTAAILLLGIFPDILLHIIHSTTQMIGL